MKKLVIVAPTFNEEANIENFLRQVLLQKDRLKDLDLEVVVSDSHSADDTAKIVKKMARENKKIHYLDVEKRGLGLGILKGLDYAVDVLGADFLITMEADLSNDPGQIPDFFSKLKTADLVIGSRYTKGGQIVNWSWWRKAFSSGANHLLKIIVWTNKTEEFTNLYRAFTKELWHELRSKVSIHQDWIFVPAFVFYALDSHFKIVQQPITYYDRFGGRSKMKTLSYTKNLLHFALRYKLLDHGPHS